MCLFIETQYQCKHTCFELYMYCHKILTQLVRITDAKQREMYDLPFNPYCPDCEPYVFVGDPTGLLGSDGRTDNGVLRTNIVQRVVDLLEVCPDCDAHEQ